MVGWVESRFANLLKSPLNVVSKTDVIFQFICKGSFKKSKTKRETVLWDILYMGGRTGLCMGAGGTR